jgi:hypothetical protein
MASFISSFAKPQTWQEFYGEKSTQLDTTMTEDQVKNLVGYLPNKVELKTCGADLKSGPWQCKIYTFGSDNFGPGLIVYFQKDHGHWYVNGWNVAGQ